MAPGLVITIPIWIKENPKTIAMTYDCISRIQTTIDAPVKVYVVSNRLHMLTPEEFQTALSKTCKYETKLVHQDCVSRSVAGAWNEGTIRGLADGCDTFILMANDCLLRKDTIDQLLAYKPTAKTDSVSIWSGVDIKVSSEQQVTDGADFTCLMYTRDTIYKHGYFDAEFKPAYFEDNDYYCRVILGGEHCRVVHSAKFYHHGSATSVLEPECAKHAQHWFPVNRRRFNDKWGVQKPAADETEVIQTYYRRPWNDPNRPLSSW